MVSILSWWQGGSEYSCTILQLSIQWATVKRATKTCNLQVCIIAAKRVGKLEKAMLQGFPLCIQINMSSNRLAWISDDYFESFLLPQSEQQINLRKLTFTQPATPKPGVSWCCGNYCLLAFVLWCGYCSVSFQSFVLRHWCPQHQETTNKPDFSGRSRNFSKRDLQVWLRKKQTSRDQGMIEQSW